MLPCTASPNLMYPKNPTTSDSTTTRDMAELNIPVKPRKACGVFIEFSIGKIWKKKLLIIHHFYVIL